MHEEYFNHEVVKGFRSHHCSLWFKIKLALFGKRIEEFARGGVVYSWYAYKGKLYFWDASVFNRGLFNPPL